MSYNQLAEQFSRVAKVPFRSTPLVNALKFDYPAGWTRFDQVYSEITDATPTEGFWHGAADLVGQCPSIAHYSARTQREILQVVLRDMRSLPQHCDRIEKVGAQFRWVFADRKAA